MDNYVDSATAVLRKHGFRITMPRILVLRALDAADAKPLTPYALHAQIEADGNKTDVVSIYRILKTLLECDLVYAVSKVEGYLMRTVEASPYSVLVIDTDTGRVTEQEPDKDLLAMMPKGCKGFQLEICV
jgi:Fe2+ or Zn2+ uptake regulation protein